VLAEEKESAAGLLSSEGKPSVMQMATKERVSANPDTRCDVKLK